MTRSAIESQIDSSMRRIPLSHNHHCRKGIQTRVNFPLKDPFDVVDLLNSHKIVNRVMPGKLLRQTERKIEPQFITHHHPLLVAAKCCQVAAIDGGEPRTRSIKGEMGQIKSHPREAPTAAADRE